MSSKLVLASTLALALGACATLDKTSGSVAPRFGEAHSWNKQVQTVNPDPVYTALATTSADQAAGAAKRYRTDTVKATERVDTSAVNSASGNSSGPR